MRPIGDYRISGYWALVGLVGKTWLAPSLGSNGLYVTDCRGNSRLEVCRTSKSFRISAMQTQPEQALRVQSTLIWSIHIFYSINRNSDFGNVLCIWRVLGPLGRLSQALTGTG